MRRDAGETLAEVLVTITILGVAVATILGGLATVVNVSARHRAMATAETLLVSAAERVKADGFTAGCAAPAAPSATEVPRDAGWTVAVSAPTDAVTSGACGAATVVQLVTVSVAGPHDAARSLGVLLRDPA